MADDPYYRRYDMEAPEYGSDSDKFTVQIIHNGFFCGLRGDVDYASSTTDWFDNCSTDTFSVLWIKDFLEQLGHPDNGRTHVYWIKHGKVIEDGLICIEKDAHILMMTEASKEHKTLALIVDHTNFLNIFREDVILRVGPEVTPVLNNAIASTSTEPSVLVDQISEDGEEETDTEFYDSDWDVEDGDDDIFAANVDKEVNDNNEPVEIVEVEDVAGLEHEDIQLSIEQQHELQYKFSLFNPEVDMENPDFKVGMLFSSMKEIRAALKSYSIKERVKVHKTRNEATRVDAVCLGKCEGGCSWFLKASMDSRTEAVVVRKYCGVHKCERVWELKALTAPFLTATFMDEFRDNHKMDLTTFATKVQRKFNMTPNRWKLRRARKEALLRIHGDEVEQFSLLWDYGQELRTSNPGSKFFLSTNKSTEQGVVKEHLATLYWSYDACKRGFLEECRPIICIDGCHIKTRYKGVLLTAVGVDPNDCIYPIAMGVTEVECTSSWEWFLTTLKDDLNITNSSHFTIMSDRQKGLINAVRTGIIFAGESTRLELYLQERAHVFIAAARNALPQPRVTTAMARGRATSSARGRGRGRNSTSEVEGEAPQQPATGRDRGRRNKRSAEASSSQPANTTRPRNSYRTEPGSAYHMLFGPNQQHQQQQNPQVKVPDLNEAAPEEIQTTQDAPPDF